MNHEGYPDHTADKAVSKVHKETSRYINDVLDCMSRTASLCGFDVTAIVIKDRKSGRKYRRAADD